MIVHENMFSGSETKSATNILELEYSGHLINPFHGHFVKRTDLINTTGYHCRLNFWCKKKKLSSLMVVSALMTTYPKN